MRWAQRIGAIGVVSGICIIPFSSLVLILSAIMEYPPYTDFVDEMIIVNAVGWFLHLLAIWAVKKISKKSFYSMFLIVVGISDFFIAVANPFWLVPFLMMIPLVTLILAGVLGLIKNPRLKTNPEILPSMLGILGGILGISTVFCGLLSIPWLWLSYSVVALIGGILIGKKKIKIGGFLITLIGILGFFQFSFTKPGITIAYGWILPALPLLFAAAFIGDNRRKLLREQSSLLGIENK